MTCTCSGHPNEPNPCSASLSREDRFDAIRCAFDDGDLDQQFGEWVRDREGKYRILDGMIEDFLESRVERAIDWLEEE